MIRDLHVARIAGDLAAMCRLFADHGRFEIAGASADKPIAIRSEGLAEFRPWLAMMTKVFRLSDYTLLSLVVEWPRASARRSPRGLYSSQLTKLGITSMGRKIPKSCTVFSRR